MMDLPISLLRTFIIVAGTLNITAAAKQLNRAPSTVSMQLNRLEALVTVTLLERTKYGVQLTAAGEQLLSHADHLLRVHDGILGSFLNASIKGTVRFGTHDQYVTHSLVPLLQGYMLSYPKVRLEVVCDHRPHYLASLVENGQLDAALVDMPSLSNSGLSLGRDRFIWAKAETHPVQLCTPLPLALSPEGGLDRDVALRLLKQHEVPHRVAFTSYSRTSILAAVRAGVGIAVIPETALEKGLVIIEEGLPRLPQKETSLIIAANIGKAADLFVCRIKERVVVGAKEIVYAG